MVFPPREPREVPRTPPQRSPWQPKRMSEGILVMSNVVNANVVMSNVEDAYRIPE